MLDNNSETIDRVLLVEIVLIAGLVALGAYLYWWPAAEGDLAPRWWHWLAVCVLFFGVVALHTWRRKQRSHASLHEAIREEEV